MAVKGAKKKSKMKFGVKLSSNPRRNTSDLPRKRKNLAPSKVKKDSILKTEESKNILQESLSLVLLAFGIFLAVSLYSNISNSSSLDAYGIFSSSGQSANMMGIVGEFLSSLLVDWLGWCSFVSVILAFLLSRTVWVNGWPRPSGSVLGLMFSILGSILMVVSLASVVSVFWGYPGGGKVGSNIAYHLINYVNEPGALLVSFVVFVISFALGTGIETSRVLGYIYQAARVVKNIFSDLFYLLNLAIGWIVLKVASVLRYIVSSFSRVIKFIFSFIFSYFKEREKSKDVSFNKKEGFILSEEKESKKNILIKRNKLEKVSAISKIRTKNKKKSQKKAKKGDLENKLEESKYILPSLELLTSSENSGSLLPDDKELLKNSSRLENALENFKIKGKIVEAQPGPVVTLYQFRPAPGVKVQKIITLSDDLALALKVASLRVYAPVPGMGTVGIEVPNENREIVRLRNVFDSELFKSADSDLMLALGEDTFGDPYTADLSKMPHLLIAGATGTGKSVCINSILMSLLYRNSPKTLRLLLIDPKMLELSIYEGIPHLKAPVVTNAKRARGVLWWAVEEMERRYRLMKDLSVRSLSSYNAAIKAKKEGQSEKEINRIAKAEEYKESESKEKEGDWNLEGSAPIIKTASDAISEYLESKNKITHDEFLPHIVIIVDELADLMLTVGREIEELITRLAQKARAAGIHLILATQRPSVNVITGLIKANFPARISFQVASRIDARTVMDKSGAERLLGRGDMLFLPPGTAHLKRLHSPFVSDKEVRDVTDFIRSQGEPDYDSSVEEMVNKLDDSLESSVKSESGEQGDGEYDPLYDKALSLVIEKGHASTSMVQRVFRIGYNRAARILDTMEQEGVVGPQDGSKPREVLMHKDM